MTAQDIPALASLDFVPYLNSEGQLPEQFQGKVGVYAVFDQAKTLQFVGFSRDVSLSLKQHLVRQIDRCYWVKVKTVDRPSRSVLEEIRAAWIEENGSALGDDTLWTQPIQVKALMTPEEQANYQNPIHDEVAQGKVLKNVARRVEADILAQLKERGVQSEIRFNPKIKEEGLLDLK